MKIETPLLNGCKTRRNVTMGFFYSRGQGTKIVLNIIISNTDFVRTLYTSGQNARSSRYVLYGDTLFPHAKS